MKRPLWVEHLLSFACGAGACLWWMGVRGSGGDMYPTVMLVIMVIIFIAYLLYLDYDHKKN